MARWVWVLTVSAIAAVEASITCGEQYLNYLLERASVAVDTVAACTEASTYAFNSPQVPATGQILIDVCASDACMSIIQALDGLSNCNLPNCSATASMASWSSASQDFGSMSASGTGDAADGITAPTTASAPISTPTSGGYNAEATIGVSLVASLVPICTLML